MSFFIYICPFTVIGIYLSKQVDFFSEDVDSWELLTQFKVLQVSSFDTNQELHLDTCE